MSTSQRQNKQQIQFSKKIVVSTTVSVTAICVISIILMYAVGSVQYMAQVIKSYVTFAMIVFASYSGNSIAQKFILNRNMGAIMSSMKQEQKEDKKQDQQSNG